MDGSRLSRALRDLASALDEVNEAAAEDPVLRTGLPATSVNAGSPPRQQQSSTETKAPTVAVPKPTGAAARAHSPSGSSVAFQGMP